MNPGTVTLAGARGGHGTTTVATALAILAAEHGRTQLASPDATALLAIPSEPSRPLPVSVTDCLTVAPAGASETSEPTMTIIDAGPLRPCGREADPLFIVLRGPCYLGLRHVVTMTGRPPDGVILVCEPGRSLTRRDVEDVIGAPVVATVAQHAAVARTVDAGLLLPRASRLPQFRELRRLARDLFDLPDRHPEEAVA